MAFTALTSYPNFGTRVATPPIAFPTALLTGVTWNSDLMPSGYGGCAFGATSDQIVTIKFQRYMDLAGTTPLGALVTAALTANTPASISVADGLPFLSWNAQIVNASGSTANLTGLTLLTGPMN